MKSLDQCSVRLRPVGQSANSVETFATTSTTNASIPMDAMTVWYKADGGLAPGVLACWPDQTANNWTCYHPYNDSDNPPAFDPTAMNGLPAVYFGLTNSFRFPLFYNTGWSQAQAFVVVRSLGVPPGQLTGVGMWYLGHGSESYPDPSGYVYENFFRGGPISIFELNTPTIAAVVPKNIERMGRLLGYENL